MSDKVYIDGQYMTEDEAIAADRPVCTREEFEDLRKQVNEVHAFVKGVAEALNNPMIKSMLPPNMRGMV